MSHLLITPQNVAQHPWLWNFLEEQRQANIEQWDTTQTYSYGENTFQFAEPVFARLRKENRGYAYEMVSPICIGKGGFGAIYPISCTISNGKNGLFQAKDHQRLAKYQKASKIAMEEYNVSLHAKYLKVKQPINGLMVLKKMPGETLYDFLNKNWEHPLSPQTLLHLTKTILLTYRAQVEANKIHHNDISQLNVMVDYHPENTQNSFEINFIDFGIGAIATKPSTTDFYGLYFLLVDGVWNNQTCLPQIKAHLDLLNFEAETPLDKMLDTFNNIIIAPDAIQEPLRMVLNYFDRNIKNQPQLEKEFKTILLETVNSNICQLNHFAKAILKCKTLLDQHQLDMANEFLLFTETKPETKNAFGKIFAYFEMLETKGKALASKGNTNGNELCSVASTLKEKTLAAMYLPTNKKQKALLACQEECKQLLKSNQKLLNIHRNSHYIWAEIGVILCSLIVLYPIAAGINYLRTGHLGFFSQTKSAEGALEMDKNFKIATLA